MFIVKDSKKKLCSRTESVIIFNTLESSGRQTYTFKRFNDFCQFLIMIWGLKIKFSNFDQF